MSEEDKTNPAYAYHSVPDDEISLRELWEIIVKRKWVVFVSTVVCLGLAVVYLLLTPTVYESNAVIQIGQVAGQPLDSGTQLASRLMNQYTPVNTVQAKKQLPRLHSVTPDKTEASILTLEAYGKSPQDAQQYLTQIIQKFLKDNQQRYQQIVATRQAQLKQLQTQYQDMRKTLISSPDVHAAHSDPLVLYMEQTQHNDALIQLQSAMAKAENALAANNTSPSLQTLSPRYDPNPVSPKKTLILVLAILGGLILGGFLALLQNALRKNS
ncbi:Wzz/FepE/Etk N-terminal domain-containing protein [Acidithiobacillus sp.]|uniref:Wzz/FepE/Etk N-terminal domain-containing protein n=1 Tax=Acidithiobacillus sp. TaxID=1872118 RepID=UPI002606F3D1|nr:Wzz/FepE/Etk N-terminal domain-containing protein [Acidithiobacillus sp.]MDD2748530.1 Wzz/FepE/Etk N-terminal domain-containing protein [Acidithiobacillus sp.]MDD5279323.1 Wzz/FepE/Etk N-terminal domain-containing protein [Acidithiobacillus sp.]